MEATIISLLVALLGIMQNPSVPAEQKLKIYNQVIPIVQNLNRELHDKTETAAVGTTTKETQKVETDYVGS